MIWGYLYIALMTGSTLVVLRIGERESRTAILTLFAASAFTLLGLYFSGTRFEVASLLVSSLDFLVLAIFLGHALVSKRYWTLCLPALQLITCTTHVLKAFAPEIIPRVYSAGQGFWAYPQMLIILLAAIWAYQDRRARSRTQGARRDMENMP
ncbi:hypothetical protein [Sphingopyxis sp.]|uniref:hypothetical protein n=1 Tax=Sphingopyxis sp. TaxID=1908224 RepID=UPI003D0BAFB4